MQNIYIITLFPQMVKTALEVGVIGKYFSREDVNLEILNPSDFSPKGFKGVDDHPFGGGPGMVMRADVLATVFQEKILLEKKREELHVIYPSPRGPVWSNNQAKNLLVKYGQKDLVFICGRYEGIDERFIQNYVDQEISIGDYVLSGGELASCIIIDSMLRFEKNVLGNDTSSTQDSFENNLLDSPKFTRPRDFEGLKIPEILLSGDHEKIKNFEATKRLEETKKYRPDLLV